MSRSPQPLLQICNLAKTITLHLLGGKQVQPLRNVSFDLWGGEFLGVAGPSGSGKSSLLKCIYRTYISQGGRIGYRTASGGTVDLAAASERTVLELRRNELGYVSQFLQAPPRVPAWEVVARAAVRRGVAPEIAEPQARELLQRLDIGPQQQDSYPAVFSGGEQQRINVARALMAPYRLLLLDEPTSALDQANRERVLGLLGEAQDRGTALLGVFHDRQTLSRRADRVIVLENGLVTRQGATKRTEIQSYWAHQCPKSAGSTDDDFAGDHSR